MKVSVITVCYNAIQGIEKTILSVISQTYPSIEFIVIDGGSVDGTMDVIKKYQDKISYMVSEADNGIYDAMNKGLKAVTGEWINFLNAGDVYYNSQSIENIFSSEISNEVDVVYGYQIHNFIYGKFVRRKLPLSFFKKGMPFGHESSFVRSEVMRRYGFDTDYCIAADYHFFFHLYALGKKFQFVDVLVAVFDCSDGVSTSDKTALLTLFETSKVNGSIGTFKYIKSWIRTYAAIKTKSMIRRISPNFVENRQRHKREKNLEYVPLSVFMSNRHV
jgi:glycosyltransferase involved in cell wall biosynthesis